MLCDSSIEHQFNQYKHTLGFVFKLYESNDVSLAYNVFNKIWNKYWTGCWSIDVEVELFEYLRAAWTAEKVTFKLKDKFL